MPRWIDASRNQPGYMYSPERLEYMRNYNREYRKRLRGGKPPMPYVERGILGNSVMRANLRRKKMQESAIQG